MENIVRIEELDACVAETLLAIQRGVAKARAEGFSDTLNQLIAQRTRYRWD